MRIRHFVEFSFLQSRPGESRRVRRGSFAQDWHTSSTVV